MASGFSATVERVSRMSKNCSSPCIWKNRRETKPIACSSRPISSVAKPMKLTISPTLALPCRLSQVPSTKMAMTVMVEAARVSTLTTAHRFSTGYCATRTRRMV